MIMTRLKALIQGPARNSAKERRGAEVERRRVAGERAVVVDMASGRRARGGRLGVEGGEQWRRLGVRGERREGEERRGELEMKLCISVEDMRLMLHDEAQRGCQARALGLGRFVRRGWRLG